MFDPRNHKRSPDLESRDALDQRSTLTTLAHLMMHAQLESALHFRGPCFERLVEGVRAHRPGSEAALEGATNSTAIGVVMFEEVFRPQGVLAKPISFDTLRTAPARPSIAMIDLVHPEATIRETFAGHQLEILQGRTTDKTAHQISFNVGPYGVVLADRARAGALNLLAVLDPYSSHESDPMKKAWLWRFRPPRLGDLDTYYADVITVPSMWEAEKIRSRDSLYTALLCGEGKPEWQPPSVTAESVLQLDSPWKELTERFHDGSSGEEFSIKLLSYKAGLQTVIGALQSALREGDDQRFDDHLLDFSYSEYFSASRDGFGDCATVIPALVERGCSDPYVLVEFATPRTGRERRHALAVLQSIFDEEFISVDEQGRRLAGTPRE